MNKETSFDLLKELHKSVTLPCNHCGSDDMIERISRKLECKYLDCNQEEGE